MGTLQAGWKIGCYELVRLLGEGGMGEVWLAHDGPADRQVALKFIKPHLLNNPGMRTRFTNEARTLGKLDHDRIVTLYTVVEEGKHLAFVLRFIEGHSLADKIEAQHPLPMSFVLSSARDILTALGEAHQRGIIHRDIKPQNILIDRKDRSFLTDFGIAVTDFLERATVGPSAIGTPHYMSPEQITRPREITIAHGGQRTDIYSYGVVLYEMLTGRVPFGQDSGAEEIYTIQQSHCQDVPPLLRSFNGSISPAMEEVVLHCLEKNPDHRPQTCAELLAEIEAAARGTAPQRPATVMESPVARRTVTAPGAGPAAFPQVAPIQAESSSRRRSPMQRNMVLAAAALVLVGGLGFTLYSISGKHDSTRQELPVVQTHTPPTDAGTKGSANTTRVTPPVYKDSQQDPNTGSGKATKQNIAVAGDPPGGPAVPKPVPSQSAEEKQAAVLAGRADQEYKSGDYCQALATLNEAIALHSDPRYTASKSTYERGCNSQ